MESMSRGRAAVAGVGPEGFSGKRTGGLIMVPGSGQTALPAEVLTVCVDGSGKKPERRLCMYATCQS